MYKKISRCVICAAVCLLTVCSCEKRSEMDRFIDSLMDKLSVEQKIGQLNLHSAGGFVSAEKVNTDDVNIQMVMKGQMGGLYGGSNLDYLRQVQQLAVDAPGGVPLIFGQDVIHGFETVFPVPLAIAQSWNMVLVEQSARLAAREATARGINWVFSPMVDIARDARWGRIVEGAGEDPYLGAEVAKAMVYGYQGRDEEFSDDEVMACVKHYALYGGAEAGRDYNTVDLSRQGILNGYMRPYKAAAEAGAGSYMSSFNEYEGIPASANHYLLTELLRDEWGFDGFVVSDATAVQEMVAHGIGDLQEVSARGLQAGLDMDMNSDGFVGTLKKSLDEGRIKMEDIDRACRRILEAKYKFGLFEDPFKYLKGERLNEVFSEENRAFARELSTECQVLLKNDGVLPLSKDARIAVVGPFADNSSDMKGAWAMGGNDCVTIYRGISEALSQKGRATLAEGSWILKDEEMEKSVKYGLMAIFSPNFRGAPVHTRPLESLIAEAVAQARTADVVVACVGEVNNMSGEGASRTDITIPDAQQELLKALKATGKPVVLVLTTGRPLILNWEDENMDAILCTWSQGTEAGHAIADVLFGDANPSAKLTTSFPRSVGQLPLYYNHKNTGRPHGDYEKYRKFSSNYIDVINAPLYPFGYGLSYTTFEYGDVRLSSDTLSDGGTVTASVTVSNTGEYDGKEVVQLYIHDVVSTMTRPVKELRAFKKVNIKAGETVTVDFDLTVEDLKYYNHELDYVCEPGSFEIMVGPNSRDLSCATLTVE